MEASKDDLKKKFADYPKKAEASKNIIVSRIPEGERRYRERWGLSHAHTFTDEITIPIQVHADALYLLIETLSKEIPGADSRLPKCKFARDLINTCVSEGERRYLTGFGISNDLFGLSRNNHP